VETHYLPATGLICLPEARWIRWLAYQPGEDNRAGRTVCALCRQASVSAQVVVTFGIHAADWLKTKGTVKGWEPG